MTETREEWNPVYTDFDNLVPDQETAPGFVTGGFKGNLLQMIGFLANRVNAVRGDGSHDVTKAPPATLKGLDDRVKSVRTDLDGLDATKLPVVDEGSVFTAEDIEGVLEELRSMSSGGAWSPGDVKLNSGLGIPGGWLDANFQAVSRTTFADLYRATTFITQGATTQGSAVLNVDSSSGMAPGRAVEGPGIPVGAKVQTVNSATAVTLTQAATSGGTGGVRAFLHGQGDGSTTFNVIDMRDRAPVGANPSVIDAGTPQERSVRRVGETFGAEKHKLVAEESVPHEHEVYALRQMDYVRSGGGGGLNLLGDPSQNRNNSGRTSSFGGETGSARAHNNLPPSGALRFLVKT